VAACTSWVHWVNAFQIFIHLISLQRARKEKSVYFQSLKFRLNAPECVIVITCCYRSNDMTTSVRYQTKHLRYSSFVMNHFSLLIPCRNTEYGTFMQLFGKSNLCDHNAEGQMTCCSNTVLCIASRGKNQITQQNHNSRLISSLSSLTTDYASLHALFLRRYNRFLWAVCNVQTLHYKVKLVIEADVFSKLCRTPNRQAVCQCQVLSAVTELAGEYDKSRRQTLLSEPRTRPTMHSPAWHGRER